MAPSHRADLETRLADAERQLTDGQEQIERLEEQIADLARSGLLTSGPMALLASFRADLARGVAARDRLRDALAKDPGS